MNCIDCSQPLRPQGTSADNYPDTHVAFPGPRCSACYKVAPRAGRKKCADRCRECKRPMRGARQTLADRPGTVLHAARDLCVSCHAAERDGPKPVKAPVPEVPVVEDPALMGYLNQRRRRKAAADAAAARIRAHANRRHPAPVAVLPVRPRVVFDPTTYLWVMSKGGAVIGLAVSEELAWEQLGDLTRTVVAA